MVVAKVREMKAEEGFNALTDKYENLVEAGVIDPTKVVRSALQNAASIASLLLTTEALVSEIPEEKDEKAAADGRRRHGRHGRRRASRTQSPSSGGAPSPPRRSMRGAASAAPFIFLAVQIRRSPLSRARAGTFGAVHAYAYNVGMATSLGEFEQLVLLAVLQAGDTAYGTRILEEVRAAGGGAPPAAPST